MDRVIFASIVLREMARQRLTIEQMAKRLKRARNSVSTLLSGRGKRVQARTVYAYAKALRVPREMFYEVERGQR